MALDVTTKDCTALSDAELAEMADLCADGGICYEIGLLSKLVSDWVLVTQVREGRTSGVLLLDPRADRRNSSVLIGAGVRRTSKRQLPAGDRERQPAPGADGVPRRGRAGQHPHGRPRRLPGLQGHGRHRPRPGARSGAGLGSSPGQRFEIDERYDQHTFTVTGDGAAPLVLDHEPLARRSTRPSPQFTSQSDRGLPDHLRLGDGRGAPQVQRVTRSPPRPCRPRRAGRLLPGPRVAAHVPRLQTRPGRRRRPRPGPGRGVPGPGRRQHRRVGPGRARRRGHRPPLGRHLARRSPTRVPLARVDAGAGARRGDRRPGRLRRALLPARQGSQRPGRRSGGVAGAVLVRRRRCRGHGRAAGRRVRRPGGVAVRCLRPRSGGPAGPRSARRATGRGHRRPRSPRAGRPTPVTVGAPRSTGSRSSDPPGRWAGQGPACRAKSLFDGDRCGSPRSAREPRETA